MDTLEVTYAPTLKAYAEYGHKEGGSYSGDMRTPRIWEQNLARLKKDETRYTISYDEDAGTITITED
jgi:hypothetical protein